jgi:hypothetical protein
VRLNGLMHDHIVNSAGLYAFVLSTDIEASSTCCAGHLALFVVLAHRRPSCADTVPQ